MDTQLVSKDEVLDLIKTLEKPLEFYKDPIYKLEEAEDIRKSERLIFEFYNDLKNDGYITLAISKIDREEEKRIIKFNKIIMDVSNKLVKTKEFNAEEGWFILLSLYCWYCEMIKNLLSEFAFKIDTSYKGIMMMGPFVRIMRSYKKGRYTFLFSDIDVDLRNSFDHGRIDFPNNEIEYYDSRGKRRCMKLDVFLSKYKKIAPLHASLFLYRTKIFLDEIKEFAKKEGWI